MRFTAADNLQDLSYLHPKNISLTSSLAHRYHNTEIRSKATDINGKNKPIAQAEYFPDSGIIIGESRFSANDLNPPEKKVRPSDLTFLQWLDSASDPKSLRAFIGRNVLSHSTLETMQTAQRNARIPLDQPAVFKRQKDPQDGPDGDRNTDSFFLMMGTDFISNQGFMLKDHWQVRIFLVEFLLLLFFSSFGEMNTLGWSFHFFLFVWTTGPPSSPPF